MPPGHSRRFAAAVAFCVTLPVLAFGRPMAVGVGAVVAVAEDGPCGDQPCGALPPGATPCGDRPCGPLPPGGPCAGQPCGPLADPDPCGEGGCAELPAGATPCGDTPCAPLAPSAASEPSAGATTGPVAGSEDDRGPVSTTGSETATSVAGGLPADQQATPDLTPEKTSSTRGWLAPVALVVVLVLVFVGLVRRRTTPPR